MIIGLRWSIPAWLHTYIIFTVNSYVSVYKYRLQCIMIFYFRALRLSVIYNRQFCVNTINLADNFVKICMINLHRKIIVIIIIIFVLHFEIGHYDKTSCTFKILKVSGVPLKYLLNRERILNRFLCCADIILDYYNISFVSNFKCMMCRL